MRVLIIALLLTAPLSGCIGGVGLIESDLFDYIEVKRGDPAPVALEGCDLLLDTLNLRAEQRALVSLHQDYEGRQRGGFFGGGDVVMESATEDSADGAGAPEAAKSSGEQSYSASDADVTGTNNQEQDVDEADVIKTDGTWTYAVDGQLLHILHSTTVGNLSHHTTLELGSGYGTQLLLVDGGNDDPSDDRLVAVMSGARGPEDDDPDQPKDEPDRGGVMAEDIAYYPYYGGSYTRVLVIDLVDREAPETIAEHFIQGDNVGVRLVDGVAYVVVHQYEPQLDLRTWAGPDEETLKAEGITWQEYYELPQADQKEVLLKSIERAIEHNDEVLAEATLEDHLPSLYHPDGDNVSEQEFTDAYCGNVLTTPDDMGRSVTTILSIDAEGAASQYETVQLLGGRPIVYGATDALVLAASSQEHWWFWAQPDLDEATNLHWFDLDGLDVDHRASGRVDGIVQDQFGIDVHDDQLRVATTTGTWGRWWLEDPDPMQNHVVIFEEVAGALVEQGRVGGIAPDERLWSARFTDDRAYLITFEQIDPLWILDLTDPTDPQILGELEIPGVSTYIHPLPGEDALLTIGLGPRGDGCDDADCVEPNQPQGIDWNRIQVSLFDISDPTAPTRADVIDISLPQGDGDADEESYSWGYSAAVHEHKAFTYWDRLGMLAVPVSWNHYERSCETQGSTRTCTETQEFHTGLDLIDVDRQNMSLERYGAVDQDHLMTQEGNENGWYWGAEVQRSYFLGFPDEFPDKPVSVYAYSSIGMTAHDLETLEDQDAVGFEGGGYEYHPHEAEPADDEQSLLDDVTSTGGVA